MKTKKIEYFMQKLSEIQGKPIDEQGEKEISDLLKELKLTIPMKESKLHYRLESIQNFLNINIMLNACVSAKWSCVCAAVAVIFSFITVFITAIIGFVSIVLMLCQIIKGR